MRRALLLGGLLALSGCHRDDPPSVVPDQHGTTAQPQTESQSDDEPCLSHGKATTAADYEAIAKRITLRIAALSKRFPALDGLELDDLKVYPPEGPNAASALQFELHFEHDVSWEKSPGSGPGKLNPMEPTYRDDDAIDFSISFFTGPDMGRLMVPLIAIGAMNAKLMVLAPRADEITAAIRAILLDEAKRFGECS